MPSKAVSYTHLDVYKRQGYMCLFAYVTAMIVYQIGGLFTGEAAFSVFTVIAIALLAGIIFLLVRRGYQPSEEVRHLTDIPASKK